MLWWFWHSASVREFWAYVARELDAHRIPALQAVVEFLQFASHTYREAWAKTLPVWALLPVLWMTAARTAEALRSRTYLRGSRIDVAPTLPAYCSPTQGLTLGSVWLSRRDEIRHVLTIGRPGVGKTVLFHAALEQLLVRHEDAKLLIYDFKGDYFSRFARPGDLLFNPMDARSVSRNIFDDLEDVMDIDAVCQSLIPESRDEEKFWVDSARAVLSGILHYCWRAGTRTNAAIWEWVTRPTKDLAAALASIPEGQRGWKAIEDASSKQALGVMATLMLYAKPFEYMAYWPGGWSVRSWISAPGPSALYVSNTPRVKDTLKPVLSLCIDLLGRTLLSMPDDLQRRVYFIIDEFGTLQRLSTIADLLTLSRSKGGSVWLGVQDIGQIDKVYHRDVRQTIINACGNTIVFALADPETQRYVSQLIGEEEYEDPDLYHSVAGDKHGSFSLRRQTKTAPLLLPSELQALPDLTCLIRTSSSNGVWARTTLAYRPRPTRMDAFKPLPQLVLPHMGMSSTI
ncbi:type IV secretion system DNA-binding domain-containing protein [Nitrospira sp. Kam-Ns4a]